MRCVGREKEEAKIIPRLGVLTKAGGTKKERSLDQNSDYLMYYSLTDDRTFQPWFLHL